MKKFIKYCSTICEQLTSNQTQQLNNMINKLTDIKNKYDKITISDMLINKADDNIDLLLMNNNNGDNIYDKIIDVLKNKNILPNNINDIINQIKRYVKANNLSNKFLSNLLKSFNSIKSITLNNKSNLNISDDVVDFYKSTFNFKLNNNLGVGKGELILVLLIDNCNYNNTSNKKSSGDITIGNTIIDVKNVTNEKSKIVIKLSDYLSDVKKSSIDDNTLNGVLNNIKQHESKISTKYYLLIDNNFNYFYTTGDVLLSNKYIKSIIDNNGQYSDGLVLRNIFK